MKDDRDLGHYGRNSREQWLRVFDYIRSQGEKGATADEIMLTLDLASGAVSPRMIELKDAGYIEPVEQKRLTTHGGAATAWKVSLNWEDEPEDAIETPTDAYRRGARQRMRARVRRYYRDILQHLSLTTLEAELHALVRDVHPDPESFHARAAAGTLAGDEPDRPEPAPEPADAPAPEGAGAPAPEGPAPA